MGELPDFQDQINPDDPLGGVSCTCYAAAMAAQHDSRGLVKPSGRQVRARCRNPDGSPDVHGGTSLPQVDAALRAGWNIDLDTRIGSARVRWAEFARRIEAGQGAILQGGYNAIHPTRFAGSETFVGNHAVFVGPHWVVMDPLADGRRPGVYRYHGEAYPPALIREFAAMLILDPARGRRLGDGFAWASFTRNDPNSWMARIQPSPGGQYHYFVYALGDGRITRRIVDATSGFRAKTTPPRLVPWPRGPVLHKSLVALADGSGRHIESRFARSSTGGHIGPEDNDPVPVDNDLDPEDDDQDEPPPDIDESDDNVEIVNDDAGA